MTSTSLLSSSRYSPRAALRPKLLKMCIRDRDYLNCCNYICHFSVFQKALFDAVGGLDPACDGSQDHDLFLKLSERAVPVHVPKVLYYWRCLLYTSRCV